MKFRRMAEEKIIKVNTHNSQSGETKKKKKRKDF